MLEKRFKNKNLETENDFYRSRFVVDLKSEVKKKEEKVEKGLIEKISDINFGKYFIFFLVVPKKIILKIKKLFKDFIEIIPKTFKSVFKLKIKTRPWHKSKSGFLIKESDQQQEKEKKLAFFQQNALVKKSIFETPPLKPKSEIQKVAEFWEKQESKNALLKKFSHLTVFSFGRFLFAFIFKISYQLGLFIIHSFQFLHFVFLNIFLLFRNPLIQSQSGFKHFSFSSKKIFHVIFVFLRNIALEFSFAFKKIGNLGPDLCLLIINKRQSVKLKKAIKIRIEKQIKKVEIERKRPIIKIKREFKLVSPLKVLKLAFILFLIIAPFKLYDYYQSWDLNNLRGRVLGVTENALADLGSASEAAVNLNFSQAGSHFSKAGTGFMEAQEELENINKALFFLASLAPNEEMKMAAYSREILRAGELAAKLGENTSRALGSFFNEEQKQGKKLTELINEFNFHAKLASQDAGELADVLNKIDSNILPKEHQEDLFILRGKVKNLEKGVVDFLNITESLKEFLGATEDKRYLLVFQNNTEMRASGGFIGSFALVDFRRGEIRNLEIPGGGSYDTEGGLTELVTSPEPLHLISPLWRFWDANWWPDWPTSAEKLMWFYEKSSGPTVDGVISFTPTVFERFLEIFGEIDMSEKYGVVLNEDNFWMEVQKIVEEKPAWHDEKGEALNADGERLNPKQIIGDMLDKIIKDLPEKLNQENFISLISLLEKNLSEKHILFYFTDKELQTEIKNRGWDGGLRDSKKDYLAVINTNIAGRKSDKSIKENINHSVEIKEDGSVFSVLRITREHIGKREEDFSGVRNVNWMRIYVPEGSELLEAQGFNKPDEIYFKKADEGWKVDVDVYRTEGIAKIHENSGTKIYKEKGKTVFANWSMVSPGETAVIYLRYKLPFTFKEKETEKGFKAKINNFLNSEKESFYSYALLVQKQSGSIGSRINSSLKVASDFKIIRKYPQDLNLASDGWLENDNLNTDKYWAIIFKN